MVIFFGGDDDDDDDIRRSVKGVEVVARNILGRLLCSLEKPPKFYLDLCWSLC